MLGSDLIASIIGAGDVLFVAIYLSALAQHGLHARRAAGFILGSFAVALVALLMLERALPLLPLIGGAVILAEPSARKLAKEEQRSVALVLVALAAVIAYRFLR